MSSEGFRLIIESSFSDAPDGLPIPCSHAWTVLTETFKYLAKTACEKFRLSRIFTTSVLSIAGSGCGSSVVLSSRFPSACSFACCADSRSLANCFSFIMLFLAVYFFDFSDDLA